MSWFAFGSPSSSATKASPVARKATPTRKASPVARKAAPARKASPVARKAAPARKASPKVAGKASPKKAVPVLRKAMHITATTRHASKSPKDRDHMSVHPAVPGSCKKTGKKCYLMHNQGKHTAKYNVCNQHGPTGKCNVNCRRVAGALGAAKRAGNTTAVHRAKVLGEKKCGWKKHACSAGH